ncbi:MULTISPECIES: Abi family protein [Bifidobacterium]|uniref:Abi family protein n=1 Tax=Bifidobacterium TaxID=1678 RepID=UPI001BDC2904|nr:MULTISPECIES: Abi family protein [Bifidobacterium]MBT1160416.1 Abi family protein [Bifidobacterium sp. SO1]MBT1181651.1 Abi family protein [Bifidobacterium sp. CP2]MBW3079582.1 Abi family protein [Bifidobacterium simiiventris]
MDENDTPQLRPYPQHPPKSLDDLSAKLIDNGLSGISRELLERRIEQVGYFRLKGYWYPFLTPVSEQSAKRSLPFRQDVQFKDIWDRYLFDQELRMLVFDGIVTIEIYLKSFLAHELSVFGGEFGYMTREGLPGLSYDDHLACLSSLRSTFTKSNLPYLRHFRSTYSDPLPPYWMIVGCLSYGTLKENFYQGAPDHIKRKLATRLHIFNPNPNPAVRGDAKILSNWLETIRQARNMTAHHDRFWNETSTRIAPKLPKHRSGSHAKGWWGNDWDIFRKSSGPAAFLTMENYLTSQIDGPAWTEKFISLMDRYPQIPKSDMGFPDGWRVSPLWRVDGSAH